MKKSLAILLTLILTFSSVSILSVGTVLAEEVQNKGQILFQSDFSNVSKWMGNRVSVVDEDNDGTKDFARLNNNVGKSTYLCTPTVVLKPGYTYEYSFDIRVPEGEGLCEQDFASYVLNEKTYKLNPKFGIYQPGNTASNEKPSSTLQEGQNNYAYKGDGTNNIIRRKDFVSYWTVGDYATYEKKNYSSFTSDHYSACKDADGNGVSPNTVYKDWTTVTATFTAIDDENNLGDTVVSFSFSLDSAAIGLAIDVKNVQVKCIDAPVVPRTVVQSDFANKNIGNWVAKDGESVNANWGDEGSIKLPADKKVFLLSELFNITPGNDYALSFEIKVPTSFMVEGDPKGPHFSVYLPGLNSTGDKANSRPVITNSTSNTLYATNQSKVLRRTDFKITWQFPNGYSYTSSKSVFDATAYKIMTAVEDAETGEYVFTDPKDLYSDWTTVTATFTGVGDPAENAALAFGTDVTIADAYYLIRNIKVIETPKEESEPDTPEQPEEPEEPEEPAGPVETPYISVVDTEGNQHFYGADIGAKVDVTANADGTKTFALTYDAMEGVNSFEGWFDGETLLSTEETYTSTADVNTDNVKAKIICRSVISGGLGFESYTEKTSLAVQPEKQGTLLYEDKWGVWSIYGKNGHYETDTNTFTRYTYYQYANPYQTAYDEATGTLVKGNRVVVLPYSGKSMFGFDARGRSIVRKLDNLKPNTEYQLSFYSYNLSKWDFLERVTVANTYDLLTKTIASSETSYTVDNVKVYGYYKESLAESGIRYKIPAIADESKVLNWNKITVNFKTDDNTELYLHLAASNGYDAASTSHHYIDNLVVCETETPASFENAVDFQGAAIRRGDDKTPQALRVKFEIPNSIINIYNDNGYSLKEYGALVAYNNKLNGSDLTFETKKHFKGVAYNKDEGINKVFETTATGSVVSFALYNIGVKGDSIDYNAYNEEIALRPYSIFVDENGNEQIYYADTKNVAVFDVVDAILAQSTLEGVKPSGLTGYLSDVITARNILSGEAYDAYKAAGRNNYSQNDSMGGLTITDLGENLPIHTELQAEYLNGEYADIANFAGGVAELSRPMPITFSWNDTNSTGTLYGYLLTVSENSDLSNPLVYATANNSIDVYNFKIGTDYYWNVTAIYSDGIVVSDVDKFSTEATGPRNLYISGTTNARDLGGWTINGKQTNQGVIFRLSQIDYITVEGRNTLINEFGVKTEIDIRESKEAVNTLPDDLNYNAFHTKSHVFTASKETIIKFFGVLGNKANYPIIFHCEIGTDRTGMMGFLLNSLLGASEEQLYTDYLYSNFGYIGGARAMDRIADYFTAINAAEGETFAEKTYNYLVALGVKAEHMDTFIEMMTK